MKLIKPAGFDASNMANVFLGLYPKRLAEERVQDYLVLILHIIQRKYNRLRAKGKIGKKGKVPVHVNILRELLPREYQPYFKLLHDKGWLSDPADGSTFYQIGRRSRKFRVVYPAGAKNKWESYTVQNKFVEKKLKKYLEARSQQQKALNARLPALFDNLTRLGSSIYFEASVSKVLEEKRLEVDAMVEGKEKEHVKDTWTLVSERVQQVNSGGFKAPGPHRDLKGHRLHTVFTNMKKDVRPYLVINNEPADEVDVKNSQPYLLLKLLDPSFWKAEGAGSEDLCNYANMKEGLEDGGKKGFYHRKEELRAKGYSIPLGVGKVREEIEIEEGGRAEQVNWSSMSGSIYLLALSLQKEPPADLVNFTRLVAEGRLYEYLATECKGKYFDKQGKDLLEDRNTAKRTLVREFFEAPEQIKRRYGTYVLEEEFPTVAHFISWVKEKSHRNLALLLQRVEARLYLEKVAEGYMKANPGVHMVTVHDSFILPRSHVQPFKDYLKQELEKAVGYAPKVNINPSKVSEATPSFAGIVSDGQGGFHAWQGS